MKLDCIAVISILWITGE